VLRDAEPGYFAVVMATGIMSRAIQLDGIAWLSGLLLGAGIVATVLLAAVFGWRLAAYRREVLDDAADPQRAFGFFTLAAGSDVLAARLAGDGHTAAAVVLLVIGGTSWALLGYAVPMMLAAGNAARPTLAVSTAAGSCSLSPPSRSRSASHHCPPPGRLRWSRWRWPAGE
jgi:tellurite resistance protein TehA-like permease